MISVDNILRDLIEHDIAEDEKYNRLRGYHREELINYRIREAIEGIYNHLKKSTPIIPNKKQRKITDIK